MKNLLIGLLVVIGLSACGSVKLKPLNIEAPQHPESVVAYGDYMFVSNFGSELAPQAKDGDGFISRYRLNGDLMETRFIGRLNAPKGMVIHNGFLWVADVDHLLGYDADNSELLYDISFEGETSFLNGIAVEDDGHLFVSATDNGKVYRVDVTEQSFAALDIPALPGPNGLAYDQGSKTLYVVGFGSNGQSNGTIGKISFAPVAYEQISEYMGMLDGARLRGEWLYLTDWKGDGPGEMLRYNTKSGELVPVPEVPPLMGPADFHISADGKFAIIPALIGNKVVSVKLKK